MGQATFTAPTLPCPSTCTGDHTIACTLPAGHDGPHRSGPPLSWWDPPRVLVGGVLYQPGADVEVRFSWERP